MKINKKFVSMLVLISVIFLTGIGSCATWNLNEGTNVNIGHEPIYFDVGEDEVYFTVTTYNGESLKLVDGFSGKKTELILHPEGQIKGGLITSNGYLFYCTDDGIFKRTLDTSTPTWANGEPVILPQNEGTNVTVAGKTYQSPEYDMASVPEEYDENVIKITSQTAKNGILREEDNNIYYTTDGNDFYTIDMDNNLNQFYKSYSNNLEVFDIYNGQIAGLNYVFDTYNGNAIINVYYEDEKIYQEKDGSVMVATDGSWKQGSIEIINPNKIYIGAILYYVRYDADYEDEVVIRGIYNSTGSKQEDWGYNDESEETNNIKDFSLSYKEPIFAQITNSGNNLFIAKTQDTKSNPKTKPVELEYPSTRLSTEQDQYYNNTPISIQWGIEGQTVQIPEDEFRDNYRYQIDFINPDGFKFNEYRISASDLDITSVPLSDNIQFEGYGTVRLNPPSSDWNNGTYTVRLFEVNRTTSGKALLTQHSYEVVNESSAGGGTVEEDIEDKTGADFFSDIIGSQYFWAMFIIVIPAVALGSVQGISGMFVGTGIGIILTYLGGFLPLWVMLVFIMLIAIGMSIIMRDTITSKY